MLSVSDTDIMHMSETWPHDRDAEARLWLQSLFPPMFRYHDYLHGSRGDPDTGLVYVYHPWETEVSADSALWLSLLRETR